MSDLWDVGLVGCRTCGTFYQNVALMVRFSKCRTCVTSDLEEDTQLNTWKSCCPQQTVNVGLVKCRWCKTIACMIIFLCIDLLVHQLWKIFYLNFYAGAILRQWRDFQTSFFYPITILGRHLLRGSWRFRNAWLAAPSPESCKSINFRINVRKKFWILMTVYR